MTLEYSALKEVQGIATRTTRNLKTIVTYLKPYDKCMRMTNNPVIRDNFIFCFGELHTVFAMQKWPEFF